MDRRVLMRPRPPPEGPCAGLGSAVASHHVGIRVATEARTVGHGHKAFSRRDKLAEEARLEFT